MRSPSMALALGMLSVMALLSWAGGCTGLSSDCQLNLNCPPDTTKPPPSCTAQLLSSACDACLQAQCCQEVSDCDDTQGCVSFCVFGTVPPFPQCNTPGNPTTDVFIRLDACMRTNCPNECPPSDMCNPVTHTPQCPADGSSCEMVYPGSFICLGPSGTPAGLCQPCSLTMPPFCGSGLRCHPATNTCGRYCCSDADCGTGRCELNQNLAFGGTVFHPENAVGLCVNDTTGGPSCDAAGFPPPSGGTCFVTVPPM
jgi:hypothetical protein